MGGVNLVISLQSLQPDVTPELVIGPKTYVGPEPDRVTYATLNISSLKTMQASDGAGGTDSCVYAVVSKNTTRPGQ